MPVEMCKYQSGAEGGYGYGKRKRKVIHVNKRPDREPFYTGPDRENFKSLDHNEESEEVVETIVQ